MFKRERLEQSLARSVTKPLWEEIQRKFPDYLHSRKDAHVHFLSAMVLELKQTPGFDGTARLSTK
ncbi:MAG: hypothetical protein NTY26_01160 [Burkholderiales bacterium]|nr:hypothetical protein [Burkholderiales bacterium]